MTTPDPATSARTERITKILHWLDQQGWDATACLARCDDNYLWFRTWTAALGFWARVPSDETRAAVREAVRARLPPLAEIYRDQLEQLERNRKAGMEVWKP